MQFIYSVFIRFAWVFVWLSQFFSAKMRLFVRGRREIFSVLTENLLLLDKTIWFHCASLGEYEQGVPVMEALKKQFPTYKLVVSFFSPSGFEVKKNASIADVTVYLPWDTKTNASRFIKAVNPVLAVFVKYEIWANHLFELKKREIPAVLISALFRENQVYFKPYGGFLRRALKTFDSVFVQDNKSLQLAKSIDLQSVLLSGDTRFDRVLIQLRHDNRLGFIETFKADKPCLVCGSIWEEDQEVLLNFINTRKDVKIIIAPHQISVDSIKALRKKITCETVLFSEKEDKNLSDYSVFIIDTVGLLTKIYSYADVAFVGGAMGNTGLHNILEPAVFSVPVVIGTNYTHFPEAKRLKEAGGLYSIGTSQECTAILDKLFSNIDFRTYAGKKAKQFIEENKGATTVIVEYIYNLSL